MDSVSISARSTVVCAWVSERTRTTIRRALLAPIPAACAVCRPRSAFGGRHGGLRLPASRASTSRWGCRSSVTRGPCAWFGSWIACWIRSRTARAVFVVRRNRLARLTDSGCVRRVPLRVGCADGLKETRTNFCPADQQQRADGVECGLAQFTGDEWVGDVKSQGDHAREDQKATRRP